jgi:calcium/calmodulin-dependent protein kinase I
MGHSLPHRGTFSVVKNATQKSTGEKFALKCIDKESVDKDDLLILSREIVIMKKVSHKNVVAPLQLLLTRDCRFLN